jgi:glycosyltransferase involved in cell wall biosynthesis
VSSWQQIGRGIAVVPTYNEVTNLEDVVRRIREHIPDLDVLVVDDASPDGTGELADKLAEADPHVHVLHRLGKQGLGVAYLDGFG